MKDIVIIQLTANKIYEHEYNLPLVWIDVNLASHTVGGTWTKTGRVSFAKEAIRV
jgi:hypothetical protein